MPSTVCENDELLIVKIPLRLTRPELATLIQDANLNIDSSATPVKLSDCSLVGRAKWLYQFEQKRRALSGIETLLGDPSWMILLDLYIRDAEGLPTSVSSATLASAAPPTTGLRHVTVLEAKGYIQRKRHPVDNRSVFVSLTDHARNAVSAVLEKAC